MDEERRGDMCRLQNILLDPGYLRGNGATGTFGRRHEYQKHQLQNSAARQKGISLVAVSSSHDQKIKGHASLDRLQKRTRCLIQIYTITTVPLKDSVSNKQELRREFVAAGTRTHQAMQYDAIDFGVLDPPE